VPDREDELRGGRRREAAHNNVKIRASAHAVFATDPAATVADVAAHAGVGISALYKRYANKEALIRSLCAEGLERFIAELERTLGEEPSWPAFSEFLRRAVDADATALTIALAGTFTPTPELFAAAQRAESLLTRLVERTQLAGLLRADVVPQDISLLLEQLASIRLVEPARDRELRQRSLTIALDGLRASRTATPLHWTPPSADELSARWRAPVRRGGKRGGSLAADSHAAPRR
jgi:AcrR family transcriptional regulator